MQVAIQESVVVSSAVVNEKNSLELTITQGAPVDVFTAMQTGASMDSDSQKMLFFPVDNKWYGKEATSTEMVMKFRALVAKLTEAIKHQVAEVKFNMFEGTGITSAGDIQTKITQADVAEKIGLNIYTQFAAMVEKSDKTKTCRMKLVRQSAAKHFPTLPETLLFKKDGGEWTVPFTESMDIPKEQSKLAYSKSEVSKGLHIADKVVADSVPSDSVPFEL